MAESMWPQLPGQGPGPGGGGGAAAGVDVREGVVQVPKTYSSLNQQISQRQEERSGGQA